MYTTLAVLPCLATMLALAGMLACLPAMWRRLERPYTPASDPAEVAAWAATLDAELTPTTRVVILGLVADPWRPTPRLAARLGESHLTMYSPIHGRPMGRWRGEVSLTV